MKLQLTRPLCFFDLETTGINVASDRIIEISILKLHPHGGKDVYTRRINPEMPISAEASQITGITNEDVKDCPTFKDLSQEILHFIGDADLAGYNSNKFDIPVLVEEFLRVDIDLQIEGRKLVDVQNIFHKMEQRTLAAAYRFYCSKELENAHSAEADITATAEVLEAQLERYPDLKPDVDFLHEFSQSKFKPVDFLGRVVWNEYDEEVFNFGKHKGKKVTDVFTFEPSYYSWMMNGDFPLYTKKVITDIWNKMKQR